MIASYVSVQTNPVARGNAFGRSMSEQVQETAAVYERLFRSLHGLSRRDVERLGQSLRRRLDTDHPHLSSEIVAIADGADLDPNRIFAINARTEILAGRARPECTVLGVMPERTHGPVLLAQNWDWHPDTAASRVLWTVHCGEGRSFTTLTEAGILAKIGLNSRGLGLCINILGSSRDGGVEGTPVHVLMRRVLEECGNVAEARALLRTETASGSSAFTVAQAAGADGEAASMTTFEVSPVGLAEVQPAAGRLVHTNHFIHPPAGVSDLMRTAWPDSIARYDEALRRVQAMGSPVTPEMLRTILASHESQPISVCCHDPDNPVDVDRQETLASVQMNLDLCEITVTPGPPCREQEPVTVRPLSTTHGSEHP